MLEKKMATSTTSTSPSNPAAAAESSQTHTRTYQACIPCRTRKVRCDLGPVDAPSDGPCSRCRRESKECYFSATRRKRKTDGSVEPGDSVEPDDYEIRNGRKRVRPNSSERSLQTTPAGLGPARASSASRGSFHQPLTPGGHVGNSRPLRRPGSQPLPSSDEDEQTVNNDTAAYMQHKEVFHQGDALTLLAIAGERDGKVKRERSESMGSLGNAGTASTASPMNGHVRASDNTGINSLLPPTSNPVAASGQKYARLNNNVAYGIRAARAAWSKVRFVKAGWFSVDEAMSYVHHFYEHLSPLTPITVPDFKDPATHAILLTQEPILAVTILTIASRYLQLPGPGMVSRGFMIHDELWKYLQAKLNRVVWAQEKFGGPFSGAGMFGPNDPGQGASKSLRTTGTVESLLLLTEWHCRSLHFPASDDNNELMSTDDYGANDDDAGDADHELRGRKIATWLEPCWRSERMCWSLLGLAMSLSCELGIFDDISERSDSNHPASGQISSTEILRKQNLKKLLFVYITQTSGRLQLPSMLPDLQGSLFDSDPVLRMEENANRRTQFDKGLSQPASPEDVKEVVLYFWCQLTQLMKDGNRETFPSRAVTRELISSGKYVDNLHRMGARLAELKGKLDKCKPVPTPMRHILFIEFEYIRAYCNSLALQAVVMRCTKNNTEDSSGSANGAIPPKTLLKWSQGDRAFIKEIVEASNNVLKCIVYEMVPGGQLKNLPVRTFFRIVSVCMVMLKCFSLGQVSEQAAYTLGLFDRAVEALRTSIVDDVHVASRMADLLQTLTQRLRDNLVRIGNTSGNSPSASRPVSRAPTPPAPATADYRAHHFAPTNGNVVSAANEAHRRRTPPERTRQAPHNYVTTPTISQAHSPHNLYGRASMSSSYAQPTSTYMPPTPAFYNEDPLRGINQQEYDPLKPSMSIIPPGLFSDQNNDPFTADYSGRVPQGRGFSGHSNMDTSSYLDTEFVVLPLDPLLAINDADVSHTGFGPELGGQDMLDFYAQQYAA